MKESNVKQVAQHSPANDASGPLWVSARALSERLGISRSQVGRLAVKAGWRRLSVTSQQQSASGGVRYLLSDVEAWERQNTF